MPGNKISNVPDLGNFGVSKVKGFCVFFFNLSWQDTEVEFVYECESLKILAVQEWLGNFAVLGIFFYRFHPRWLNLVPSHFL